MAVTVERPDVPDAELARMIAVRAQAVQPAADCTRMVGRRTEWRAACSGSCGSPLASRREGHPGDSLRPDIVLAAPLEHPDLLRRRRTLPHPLQSVVAQALDVRRPRI